MRTGATVAVTMLLMTLARDGPRIRHVPRAVDPLFATRIHICPGGPASVGGAESNDAKRSVGEFLGPELREVEVHQTGDGYPDFDAVARHVRRLLDQRPRSLYHYPAWAEATSLAAEGVLGTLRYTGGRTGRVEVAGIHLCVQDSLGGFWWIRVAPTDVWP